MKSVGNLPTCVFDTRFLIRLRERVIHLKNLAPTCESGISESKSIHSRSEYDILLRARSHRRFQRLLAKCGASERCRRDLRVHEVFENLFVALKLTLHLRCEKIDPAEYVPRDRPVFIVRHEFPRLEIVENRILRVFRMIRSAE